MTITSVNVKKLNKEDSKMKGIVTVVVDDCIAIHGIKIIAKKNDDGSEKVFVAMPSRKTPNGENRDIVHPIDQKTRDEFERVIIAEYNKIED